MPLPTIETDEQPFPENVQHILLAGGRSQWPFGESPKLHPFCWGGGFTLSKQRWFPNLTFVVGGWARPTRWACNKW